MAGEEKKKSRANHPSLNKTDGWTGERGETGDRQELQAASKKRGQARPPGGPISDQQSKANASQQQAARQQGQANWSRKHARTRT